MKLKTLMKRLERLDPNVPTLMIIPDVEIGGTRGFYHVLDQIVVCKGENKGKPCVWITVVEHRQKKPKPKPKRKFKLLKGGIK